MYSESITKAVLENCLQIMIRRIPHSRTLSIGLFVDHGAKDEDPVVNGISHFIEHVSFNYKNMDYPTKQWLGDLMDHGALYEAFTGKEMTRCTLSAQKRYFPDMIRTLSRIVTNCNTLEENVDHERAIILQEADTYFSSARVKEELIEQALWGNRSLGLFVIGTRNNIAGFSSDQLQTRFTNFYTPSNTKLIIQGDVDTDEMLQHVSQAFGEWKNSSVQTQDVFIEVEPSLIGIGSNKRVDLTIAFVGPSFHSRERHAMNLLADILGRGLKSRLFVELREKKELAYQVFAYTRSYELSGYLAINVNCQKDQLQDVYQGVLEILETIKVHGIEEEELQRVKAARITNLLQIPNDASKHLQMSGRYAMLNKDFFVDLETYEIQSITCEDIKRLAQSMFLEDHMGLSALGATSEDLSLLL